MNKEDVYNQSVLQMVSELVASCGYNWQNSKYISMSYGNKNLSVYDAAIKKIDNILKRGVENITEDEVYWVLSNVNGCVIYNGQHIDRHLFAKQLYFKIQKSDKDLLNSNRLVRMLKESKFLWMYVVE